MFYKASKVMVCFNRIGFDFSFIFVPFPFAVHIDMTRVFNNIMLQQTQTQDSHGDKTITFLYTNWYLEVLLRKVSTDHIVYSPRQKAFVSLVIDPQMPFSAEEYSDINGSNLECQCSVYSFCSVYSIELRALVELIGSYGIDSLTEKIMWHIASQVTELKVCLISASIFSQSLCFFFSVLSTEMSKH